MRRGRHGSGGRNAGRRRGVANDLMSAERQALGKCENTAGPNRRASCVVGHSSYDGTAK
jgi:hypothetical protein